MKLLSPTKLKRDKDLEADEKKLTKLRLQKTIKEEEKRMSELDLEPEKKRRWDEFCKWNQELEQRKARLIQEIENLENKRDRLKESIKVYV